MANNNLDFILTVGLDQKRLEKDFIAGFKSAKAFIDNEIVTYKLQADPVQFKEQLKTILSSTPDLNKDIVLHLDDSSFKKGLVDVEKYSRKSAGQITKDFQKEFQKDFQKNNSLFLDNILGIKDDGRKSKAQVKQKVKDILSEIDLYSTVNNKGERTLDISKLGNYKDLEKVLTLTKELDAILKQTTKGGFEVEFQNRSALEKTVKNMQTGYGDAMVRYNSDYKTQLEQIKANTEVVFTELSKMLLNVFMGVGDTISETAKQAGDAIKASVEGAIDSSEGRLNELQNELKQVQERIEKINGVSDKKKQTLIKELRDTLADRKSAIYGANSKRTNDAKGEFTKKLKLLINSSTQKELQSDEMNALLRDARGAGFDFSGEGYGSKDDLLRKLQKEEALLKLRIDATTRSINEQAEAAKKASGSMSNLGGETKGVSKKQEQYSSAKHYMDKADEIEEWAHNNTNRQFTPVALIANTNEEINNGITQAQKYIDELNEIKNADDGTLSESRKNEIQNQIDWLQKLIDSEKQRLEMGKQMKAQDNATEYKEEADKASEDAEAHKKLTEATSELNSLQQELAEKKRKLESLKSQHKLGYEIENTLPDGSTETITPPRDSLFKTKKEAQDYKKIHHIKGRVIESESIPSEVYQQETILRKEVEEIEQKILNIKKQQNDPSLNNTDEYAKEAKQANADAEAQENLAQAKTNQQTSNNSNQEHIENLKEEQQQAENTAEAEREVNEARNTSAISGGGDNLENPDDEANKFNDLLDALQNKIPAAIEFKNQKFEEEKKLVNEVVDSEIESLKKLETALNTTIPEAIEKKNEALRGEKDLVDKLVGEEATKFGELATAVENAGDSIKDNSENSDEKESENENADIDIPERTFLENESLYKYRDIIQDALINNPLLLSPELDEAALKGEIKRIAPVLAEQFNDEFGTNISANDFAKAINKVIAKKKKEQEKETERKRKEQEAEAKRLEEEQAVEAERLKKSLEAQREEQYLKAQEQVEQRNLELAESQRIKLENEKEMAKLSEQQKRKGQDFIAEVEKATQKDAEENIIRKRTEAYNELINTMKKYEDMRKRIASEKAIAGDSEEAVEELENKIYELGDNNLLSRLQQDSVMNRMVSIDDEVKQIELKKEEVKLYDTILDKIKQYDEMRKRIASEKKISGDSKAAVELMEAQINELFEDNRLSEDHRRELLDKFSKTDIEADNLAIITEANKRYDNLIKSAKEYVKIKKRIADGKGLETDAEDAQKAKKAIDDELEAIKNEGLYRQEAEKKVRKIFAEASDKEMQKRTAEADARRETARLNRIQNKPANEQERNEHRQLTQEKAKYIELLKEENRLKLANDLAEKSRVDNDSDEIIERQGLIDKIQKEKEELEELLKTKKQEKIILSETSKAERAFREGQLNNTKKIALEEEKFQKKRISLMQQITQWQKSNPIADKKYGDILSESIRKLNAEAKITPEELKNIEKEFAQIKLQATAAGETGGGFFRMLTERWKSLGAYLGSFVSFYQIVNFFKQMVNSIHELDDALTEMRKVSDESVWSLNNFQKESFDIADQVGSTAKVIQDSTADWMRLGESLNEAKESAKDASILLNVSEFSSIDEATTALVAMSQAYSDMDKLDIIDKLNNIGNNFSISTDQLATGLQNAAAVLKTQGNDIDKSIALLTAANSIVQDISKASTGIRTIALRIAGTETAKKELEELGESVDDYIVQTQSKTQETIRAYTAVASNAGKGIDVLDANGNLRDTYDILLDISKIYKEIQEEDKKAGTNRAKALVEYIAGKNRSNIAASVLENPELLEKVYEASQDSVGSAMEENEKYLDSISGHIAQLQNQLQKLYTDTFSSEFIKDMVNLGTDAIELLDKLISKFGLLKTAIAGIAGVWGAKNNLFNLDNLDSVKRFFTADPSVKDPLTKQFLNIAEFGRYVTDKNGNKIDLSMRDFNSIFDDPASFINKYKDLMGNDEFGNNRAVRAVQDMNQRFKDLGTSVKQYTKDIEASNGAINQGKSFVEGYTEEYSSGLHKLGKGILSVGKTLASSLLSGAISAGVSLLLSMLIEGTSKIIDNLVMTREEAEKLANQFADSFASMNQEQNEVGKNIREIEEEYETLSKGVNILGENISLTEEEFERYHEITKTIADGIPSLIQGYDDQGNAIIRLKGNVNSLTEAYEENRKMAALDLYNKKGEDGYLIEGVFKNAQNAIADNNYDFYEQLDDYGHMYYVSTSTEEYLNARKNLSQASPDKIRALYDKGGLERRLLNDLIEEEYDIFSDDSKEIQRVHSELLKQSIELETTLESHAQKMADAGMNYIEAYTGFYTELSDEKQKYISAIMDNLDFMTIYNNGLYYEDTMEDFAIGLYDLIDKMSDKDLAQIETRLNLVTMFNNGEISLGEYETKIEEINQWVSTLPDFVQKYINILFNISSDDEDKIERQKQHLKDLMGDNWKDEYADMFSAEELEVLMQVKIDEPSVQTVEERLEELGAGGSVNLNLRPEINTEDLKKAGWGASWEDMGDVATVYTNTYSNEAGTKYINFTPIIVDPTTGEYKGVMSPKELQKYAEDVIAGVHDDNLNLQIGGEFDSAKAAEEAAEEIHRWHELISSGLPLVNIDFKTNGMNIDEAKAKAQELLNNPPIEADVELKVTASDAVDSMADAKSAITSLSSLYDQVVNMKQVDGQATGYADPALLNSIESSFDKFIQTQSDNGKDVSVLNDALRDFQTTMVEFPNDAKKAQDAIDDLITAYIDQTDIIQNLTEENAEWSKAQLTAMGITNAEEVVVSRLNKTAKDTGKNLKALSDAFLANRKALDKGVEGGDEYIKAIGNLVEPVQNLLAIDGEGFNLDAINSDFIIENFDKIKLAIDGDVQALAQLRVEAAKQIMVNPLIETDSFWQQSAAVAAEIATLDSEDFTVDGYMNNSDILNKLAQLRAEFRGTATEWANYVSQITGGIIQAEVEWDYLTVEQAKLSGANGMSTEAMNKAASAGLLKVRYPKSIKYKSVGYGATAHYGGAPASSSGGGGGGGGGGGSDSSSEPNKPKEESEETFDWIEVAIQRIEEEIARLDKVVGNSYDIWINRNTALLAEMEKTKEEIKAQQIAYKEYLRNASEVKVNNGKGLNPDDYGENDELVKAADQKLLDEAKKAWATGEYQKKVREGLMTGDDIEKIQNHFLADAVKEYQTLYEKAVSAQDAVQDLQIKLGDLARTNFDQAKTQAEESISYFESYADLINERISRTEERGYFVGKNYYDQLINNEKKSLNVLRNEYDQLIKKRDDAVQKGFIQAYSEEWNNMNQEILAVGKSIEESTTNLVKFNNELRQLQWDAFDYARDRVSAFTEEFDFIIDLLDNQKLYDDYGAFNDRGWADTTLHAGKYNLYMSEALKYANERAKVEKELAKDEGNKNLIERREELIKLQQESIKNAYAEKEAVRDLVKEGIDIHLSKLQEIIDKYKESLQEAKNLYDYEKNISKQVENIGNIRKQLSAYSGDTSEEARATIQRLQNQLKDAEAQLKETQWDKYISETEEFLSDMYDDYSETLNKRLEDIDSLMTDMIGDVNKNGRATRSAIKSVTNDVAYKLSSEMSQFLGDGKFASDFHKDFVDYSTTIQATLTSINQYIARISNNYVANQIDESKVKGTNIKVNTVRNGVDYKDVFDINYYMNKYADLQKAFGTDYDKYLDHFIKYGMKEGRQAIETFNVATYMKNYQDLRDAYQKDLEKYYLHYIKWGKKEKRKGYATGSHNITSDQLAWTQEKGGELIYRSSDGALLTPLNIGDKVFTAQMSENLWKLAQLKNPSLGGGTYKSVTNNNAIAITLPNVQNYEQFKTALQNDPKMTQFIQQITIGEANGNAKLNKRRY